MKKFIVIILTMFLLTTQVTLAQTADIRYKTKSNGDTYIYKNGQLARRYHRTPAGRTVVYNSEGRVIRSYSSSNGRTRVYDENGNQIARVRSGNYNNNSYGYESPYQNRSRHSYRGDDRSISNNHSISNNRSISRITPVAPARTPICTTTFVKFR